MRVGGRERETKSRGEGSGKYYIILCTPPQDHGNSLACAHDLCTCSPESGFFQLVKIKLQDSVEERFGWIVDMLFIHKMNEKKIE